MTPEEYMRDKQKRETQAIDLIRKLQGGKAKLAMPKHFQKFMNNKDLHTDDLVLQDDIFGGGGISPRAVDMQPVPQKSAMMNPELPDNFVFNESSIRRGFRKSLSAESSYGADSNSVGKKKVLQTGKTNVSDTPQFGNSQESNGENSKGRMEIEPLNKEQFAKVMKEKQEAAKKALEEKKRKIIERNRKDLWDDSDQEEKPGGIRAGKMKAKLADNSPSKSKTNTKKAPEQPALNQSLESSSDLMTRKFNAVMSKGKVQHQQQRIQEEEEPVESAQLKGQIIQVNTRKTDSLRTVQKVLGLQNYDNDEMEQISEPPSPSHSSYNASKSTKNNTNSRIIEHSNNSSNKKIKPRQILSESEEEEEVEEKLQAIQARKKDTVVSSSVVKNKKEKEQTAHFTVEIGDDLRTPQIHIYSSKSKVHLQLSHSPSKGVKTVVQEKSHHKKGKDENSFGIEVEEEEEENEYSRGNNAHDEWLGGDTQEERKSRYFEGDFDEGGNRKGSNKIEEDTDSERLSFSNKKLFKPKLDEKSGLDIFTLSQINPNLREKNVSSKGPKGNTKEKTPLPNLLISGKPVSKAKLTNNHDNWLDLQDSQESAQNDSSEHSLMEFIRAPQKSSFSLQKQAEEEAKEKNTSRKKAQIPQELFSGTKDKNNKFFHNDWLESGPESKKSTPGKDWQIKAQTFQNQQPQFQRKDNLLTDKLLLHDKKYQEKKELAAKSPVRKNQREEEEDDEGSFGFETLKPASIVIEEKKKVVLTKSKVVTSEIQKPQVRAISGKESFGKQIWNIQETEEEQEIVYDKSMENNRQTTKEIFSVTRKKASSDKESCKDSKGGTLTNPIEIEDYKNVPEKRKRGRPRKVVNMELPVVSISSKVNLTPVDLFQDMGIYPLKKVKKTPQVKPLQQNAEANLRKLLDVFIDKNSFNE